MIISSIGWVIFCCRLWFQHYSPTPPLLSLMRFLSYLLSPKFCTSYTIENVEVAISNSYYSTIFILHMICKLLVMSCAIRKFLESTKMKMSWKLIYAQIFMVLTMESSKLYSYVHSNEFLLSCGWMMTHSNCLGLKH